MSDVLGNFISSVLLLLIGGLIANFTVNKYQKNKDHTEIRDKLVQTHSEVLRKLFRMRRMWNKWIDVHDLKLDEIAFQYEFEIAFHEFLVVIKVLTAKMSVFLKTDKTLNKEIQELSSYVDEMSEIMEKILQKTKYMLELAEAIPLAKRVIDIHNQLDLMLVLILKAPIKT